MNASEKLIWAVAFVRGNAESAGAEVGRYRRVLQSVRVRKEKNLLSWEAPNSPEAMILEFAGDEAKRVECPVCKGAAVVRGKCVGCGAEV